MKAMKQKQTEVFAEILANQNMIYACVLAILNRLEGRSSGVKKRLKSLQTDKLRLKRHYMAVLSGKDAPPPAQAGRRPAKKKRQSRVA